MITIAIPTFHRGAVLVDTISSLLQLSLPADEILIVDQTPAHPAEVDAALNRWSNAGNIRWMRLPEPSIPRAMNRALLEASQPVVLFLDDDVIPSEQIVAAHRARYSDSSIWAVAGQVLEENSRLASGVQRPASSDGTRDEGRRTRDRELSEPKIVRRFAPQDDTGHGFRHDLEFAFWSAQGRFVTNVMAGNLSVRRDRALAIGGFDENFVGAAYRFETDFARRLVAAGGRIWFEPSASVRHLKLSTGGLRTYGEHLSSPNPAHSVGDYYFALVSAPPGERGAYIRRRLIRSVLTRYHLRRPWRVVPKLIGEIRGLMLARQLARRGRQLLQAS